MAENAQHADMMHGSIFVLLKRFVEASYNYSTWARLLENTSITRQNYNLNEMYPTAELRELLGAAVRMTGASAHVLLEQFGRFLVPDLLLIYKKYINPDWKTFDMLLNTETVMHAAVRTEDQRTNPPILFVSKVNNNLLMIDYHSRRKMAALAVGIVKGIADYYHESDRVRVIPATDLNSERVQLRIEFD
ncbi:heme NO-binding domain-containing protein [Botryobacter ruber]|uniref:heme NO-binding domain-containing protein n=1 Tax=Botryobacter ruber TaxID=2171629 RepID=UPI000E0AD865|nr:heme NO-binding domain-containing protein [Botryobacter ruber]